MARNYPSLNLLCLLILLLTLQVTVIESKSPSERPITDPNLNPSIKKQLVEWMDWFMAKHDQDISDLKKVIKDQQTQIEELRKENAEQYDQLEQLHAKRQTQRDQLEELCEHDRLQQHQINELRHQSNIRDNGMTRTQLGHSSENETEANIKRSDDNTSPWEPVLNQMTNQLTHMTAQIEALKNADVQLEQDKGSVYVRWGNTGCPASSSLIYTGVMGGSYFMQPGGAANYLCLPHDPSADNTPVPSQTNVPAEIYGSEYEAHDSHQELNALCAVCRSSRTSSLMVPAKSSCPAGWTVEYQGHVMAGSAAHAAPSEFICVDDSREIWEGTNANDNGKLLYYAVTHCGSLPCPPYSNTKLVPCVVCSK